MVRQTSYARPPNVLTAAMGVRVDSVMRPAISVDWPPPMSNTPSTRNSER